MKKILFYSSIVFVFLNFSFLKAQSETQTETPKTETIASLKSKREVIRLHDDLLGKKIDLEKAKAENEKLSQIATDLSSQAKNLPQTTDIESKEAKNNAKIMKKAESARKDVDRSNDKIIDLEADIKKIETKLQNANYKVEINEK